MALLSQTPGRRFRALRTSGETLLLDGGLATELERLGCDLDHPLWSGRVVAEQPERLSEAHRRYLEAGCRVLTTGAYQLSFDGAAALGVSRQQAQQWLERSTRLALEARARFRSSDTIWVAASVGPYGAFLADGSEYRGDYGVDDDRLTAFHAERLRVLAASGADLLACETIPSEQEARVLLGLLEQVELDAWLSFSLRDPQHLSDGSPIRGLVDRLRSSCPAGSSRLVAIGFNCVAPSVADAAISSLASQTELPLIVYPNSGERYDGARHRFRSASPWASGSVVDDWPVERWWCSGVRLFGGCCRIGPQEIEELGRKLEERARSAEPEPPGR